MALGPVEVRVGLEDGRALLLELGDRVGAARHHRQVLLGVERLHVLAVVAGVLRPDVLGHEVELLEVRERRGHRLLVGQHQRVGVGRGDLLEAGQLAGQVGGGAVLVLEDGVDPPHRVLGRQRHAVAPLAARLEVERPGEAVLRLLPARGPVGGDLEARAVLDELRVDHRERVRGLRLVGQQRVQGVDVVGRADPQDRVLAAAARARAAAAAAAAAADGGQQREHHEHGSRPEHGAGTLLAD